MGMGQDATNININMGLADLRKGMGIGNDTLRAFLVEQRRANELAEQQLAATQQTNEHLTFLIRGLLATGTINRP
jgi:hypothetical protein